MTGALDRMDQELAAHSDAVLAAPTTDAVGALEDDHLNAEENAFRAIRSELEVLSNCQERGGGPLATGDMHDSMQDARAECDLHDARMRTSSSIAEMQTEERRHRDAMRVDLDDVRAQEQRLLGTPDIVCP